MEENTRRSLSSSSNEDEYHEDELPDLVLDTVEARESSSSLAGNDDSTSSSVIDLLMSMTAGRGSVSTSDISQWVDATDEEVDRFDSEQVHAERTIEEDGFKVSYVNHKKAYVPKLSGTDVYRSYLSLMPDDDDEDNIKKEEVAEERQKILAHFETLTGAEQERQRSLWTQELSALEDEIGKLKCQLVEKVQRRNVLKRLLGLSTSINMDVLKVNFNRVGEKLTALHCVLDSTEERLVNQAEALQRVAKKSVDHLAKGIKQRIAQNSSQIPKEQAAKEPEVVDSNLNCVITPNHNYPAL